MSLSLLTRQFGLRKLSVTIAAALAITCIAYWIGHRKGTGFPSALQSTPLTPYKNPTQLAADIRALPLDERAPMGLAWPGWQDYMVLSTRMRVTDPEVTRSALLGVCASPSRMRDNIRVMLLLRVCFDCPAGTPRPSTYGGWISHSAANRGETNRDMNWPVGRALTRLYMQDTIDGYIGSPYDGREEFDWLLTHCAWRGL